MKPHTINLGLIMVWGMSAGMLAASRANSDPRAALEWLARNPAPHGNGPDKAMTDPFSAWSWNDPDAADSWLEGLGPGARETIGQLETNP